MPRRMVASLAFTGCLLTAACSASHESASDARGPHKDASASDGLAADVPARAYYGYVSVTAIPDRSAPSGYEYLANAVFSASPQPAFSCAGSAAQVGACCYYAPPTPSDGGVTPPPTTYSAGDISFLDTTTGTMLNMLTWQTMPVPAYFDTALPAMPPGDTIEATAPGSTVHAFKVQSVAPAPFTKLVPAWDNATPLTIPTASDFTLQWQPDPNAQTVNLIMQAENPSTGYQVDGVIVCQVADAVGSITVARSLLGHFKSGDVCSICGLDRDSDATATNDNAFMTLDLEVVGGGGATFE